MDHYITHTETRSANDMSDTTIRETTTGKAKTEYNGDSVKTSTDLEDFPDGGLRAWLIIGRTMCTSFATIGFVNAWGVRTLLKGYNISAMRIFLPASSKHIYQSLFSAWIGSVQYALIFMPGIIVGHLFDIGYFRVPFILATILLVISTFLIAECSQYWHFLLCQGFAIGVCFIHNHLRSSMKDPVLSWPVGRYLVALFVHPGPSRVSRRVSP
ncbi:hypothetical protein EV421DRAFT_1897118 [Armillaria borealis]|uniref:MFS general substrate transporter n=1 Tax=Armillaria borealis TaxID=47425 RepID=A0AA39N056_9AGAR|nr:hypothetical protein EV421DRAFT_1897118 [Armillaria borealis]